MGTAESFHRPARNRVPASRKAQNLRSALRLAIDEAAQSCCGRRNGAAFVLFAILRFVKDDTARGAEEEVSPSMLKVGYIITVFLRGKLWYLQASKRINYHYKQHPSLFIATVHQIDRPKPRRHIAQLESSIYITQLTSKAMGLIKLGLVGAAGYAVARKIQHKHENGRQSPSEKDNRPSFRDTKSGYMHQGYCNGQCGRTCNGQQTYGLHDWSCNGQCGGQCVTQRRTAGSPLRAPAEGFVGNGGTAQSYYAAGGLGEREMLPSYEGAARSRASSTARVGDVKA